MKSIFYMLLFLSVALLPACQSATQKQAQQTADAIQKVTKAYGPPEVTTSANGYSMKAVIDGKPWKAGSMLEFNDMNNYRVYGSDGQTKIGFNLDLETVHTGTERNFADDFAADLLTDDDVGAWGGRKGKIVVTKDEGNVVEGTFYFTATTHSDPDKKVEVTDGFFRIVRR